MNKLEKEVVKLRDLVAMLQEENEELSQTTGLLHERVMHICSELNHYKSQVVCTCDKQYTIKNLRETFQLDK